jgi:DNA repair protein RecN (Recombination protein N)
MIFNEVDAEIGGCGRYGGGRKLKQLTKLHQFLCVTHLTQIAVFGDRHLVVEKEDTTDRYQHIPTPPRHRVPA